MRADLLVDTKTWESLVVDLNFKEIKMKRHYSSEQVEEIKRYYENLTDEEPDMVDMFEMIPMLCDDLIDAYGELNNLRNSMRAVEFSILEFHKKEEQRKRTAEWEKEKKKLESQCGDRNGDKD